MLRRFAAAAPRSIVAAMGARYFTPSPELVKLYNSSYDTEAFPVDIVASDSTLFAKFLYKAAEPKKEFDAILKDFDAINAAGKKLGVFWERTVNLDSVEEFKKLNPATQFTLNWMQSNGVLEQLPAVRSTLETYVNAQKKRVVAKIYVAVSEEKNAAEVKAAKELAAQLQKTIPAAAASALDFQVVADPTIVSGYAVELAGKYSSNAKGVEKASGADADIDYTNVPAAKIAKTVFPENVETDILRKYFDGLAAFDAEEAKYGA